MTIQSRQIGQLECRIVDHPDWDEASDSIRNIVVLCHGYGAPGNDLVAIGQQMLGATGDLLKGVRFIFPAAPNVIEGMEAYDARCWWPINMAAMADSMQAGNLSELRDSVPSGIDEARELIFQTLQIIQQETEMPTDKILLGGFSQGAMLMTDVALRLPEQCAALLVFSGMLICESLWRPLAEHRGPLQVLQCHGRQDTVLPFETGVSLKELLVETGFEVDFIEFDGPHTIPIEGMQQLVTMLIAQQ